jgi:hypothetical protein
MATLTNGATVLTLPDDLDWIDEFDWQPVVQQREYTLTGALWVHESGLAAGRPITLRGDETFAWMPRADLDTLAGWANAVATTTMTLSLRGTDYAVIFNREQGKPIDARPILNYNDVDPDDNWVVTLRFVVAPLS